MFIQNNVFGVIFQGQIQGGPEAWTPSDHQK